MMQDSDQDYHNFSTPSSHRLPTVSGTQAIRNAVHSARPVASGLASLDLALSSTSANEDSLRGLQRGVVTEVFGPPGIGKTTLALQASVNTISDQKANVTWIDTSSSMVYLRLRQLFDGLRGTEAEVSQPSQQLERDSQLLEHFNHMEATSLPKLLSLFLHPLADFPPTGTTLVVLDDLSSLVLSSLPRASRKVASATSQLAPTQIRNEHMNKQAFSRRAQVISSLASALQAFAAAKSVAVLVTSKASINLKIARQAILRSALTSQHWDACLGARVALYRDFWPVQQSQTTDVETNIYVPTESETRSLRYAQVVGLAGRDVLTEAVGFLIDENGLREVISPQQSISSSAPDNTSEDILRSDDIFTETGLQSEETVESAADAVTLDSEHDMTNATRVQLPKRKATEIGDADDDIQMKPSTTEIMKNETLDAVAMGMTQASQDQLVPTFQTAKKLRIDTNSLHKPVSINTASKVVTSGTEDAEDADMLLDQIETTSRIPAFSQAAADMSDPLTPSDDGVHSP